MKQIADAAEFLQTAGLLAEINRMVLHPRGLALSVIVDGTRPVVTFGPLLDAREDPEGMAFNEEDLLESAARLRVAEADGRCPISPLRQEHLGYLVQPVPEAPRG